MMRSTDHARRAQQPPRSVRAALCTWIPRVGMSVLPHCRRLSGSATTLVFFGALNGLQRAISSTFRSPRVASASSTIFSLPGWTQNVYRLLARRHSGSRHESWSDAWQRRCVKPPVSCVACSSAEPSRSFLIFCTPSDPPLPLVSHSHDHPPPTRVDTPGGTLHWKRQPRGRRGRSQ